MITVFPRKLGLLMTADSAEGRAPISLCALARLCIAAVLSYQLLR